MKYHLYYFDPELLMVDGYIYVGTFSSSEDAYAKANSEDQKFYRIESTDGCMSSLVFESSYV